MHRGRISEFHDEEEERFFIFFLFVICCSCRCFWVPFHGTCADFVRFQRLYRVDLKDDEVYHRVDEKF